MKPSHLHLLGLGLVLAACNGGNRWGGNDINLDSGGGDSGTTDGGTDGTDTDGTDTDGTDTDGTDTDGGDTDGGGDDGGPSYCHHDYQPIHETGWTKTYNATFSFNGDAQSGTASESGLGIATLPDGSEGFAYQDAVSTSGESYDVTTFVACDPGGDEGMFVVSWEGDYTMALIGFPMAYDVTATLTPGRKFLPPEYALGSVGSWDYSYNLTVIAQGDSGGPQTNPYTITGTYAEAGFQPITLFDGTEVEAYKLVNTYAQQGQTGTVNGYIEQWWVKGLGLVKEIHVNADTAATIASKELTGYSGLTID